jgi:hypothetical protein
MNISKRHHYLPQFYLRNFADKDGLLWIFDRDRSEYRQQSIKNTAVQVDYYTLQGQNGRKHIEIEEFLACLESDTKPVIEKIDRKRRISMEEKKVLAAFVSFLKVRVPDFEKTVNELSEKMIKEISKIMFSSKETADTLIKKYEKEVGIDSSLTAEKLIELTKKNNYRVKFNRTHSIQTMVNSGLALESFFLSLKWLFLRAPTNTTYITSDNPFVLLPPRDYQMKSIYGVGILTPGAKKIIPLTANTCLIMEDKGTITKGSIANKTMWRAINLCSAINSDRFLIARDRPLLEKIVKITKVNNWRKKERVQID